MEPVPVQKVSIHGATLAGLLQSVAAAGRDFDGLLLGRFQKHTETHFEDDESDAIVTERRQALVTAAICCATTCSFYDAAGSIKEDELQGLMPPQAAEIDPLVGWLSYRAGTPLQPSMREAAVTCSLYSRAAMATWQQRQEDKLPPLLFMVVSSNNAEHDGATITFEYKVFQAACSSTTLLHQALELAAAAGTPLPGLPMRLQPVELSVENLAQGLGHHKQYKSFRPFAHLPMPASPAGTSPAAQSQASAFASTAAATAQQVEALESHCDSLLRQLHAMSKQVSEEAAASAAELAENHRLQQELEQLMAL